VIGQGAKSAGTSGPVNAPELLQMLVFPVMPPKVLVTLLTPDDGELGELDGAAAPGSPTGRDKA
jgi:hypothetical protein